MSAHNAGQQAAEAPMEVRDLGAGSTIVCEITPGVVPLVTAAAETRTLDDPQVAGLVLTLALSEDGGDCVITSESAVNQTGNNTLTMADAGDEITLRSIPKGSSYVWRVASNDGVALTTV